MEVNTHAFYYESSHSVNLKNIECTNGSTL